MDALPPELLEAIILRCGAVAQRLLGSTCRLMLAAWAAAVPRGPGGPAEGPSLARALALCQRGYLRLCPDPDYGLRVLERAREACLVRDDERHDLVRGLRWGLSWPLYLAAKERKLQGVKRRGVDAASWIEHNAHRAAGGAFTAKDAYFGATLAKCYPHLFDKRQWPGLFRSHPYLAWGRPEARPRVSPPLELEDVGPDLMFRWLIAEDDAAGLRALAENTSERHFAVPPLPHLIQREELFVAALPFIDWECRCLWAQMPWRHALAALRSEHGPAKGSWQKAQAVAWLALNAPSLVERDMVDPDPRTLECCASHGRASGLDHAPGVRRLHELGAPPPLHLDLCAYWRCCPLPVTIDDPGTLNRVRLGDKGNASAAAEALARCTVTERAWNGAVAFHRNALQHPALLDQIVKAGLPAGPLLRAALDCRDLPAARLLVRLGARVTPGDVERAYKEMSDDPSLALFLACCVDE